jgi:hypothetical protein
VKLPHAGRAVVDINKHRNYCLNPRHLRGRHKARVFAAVLGITQRHADVLRRALLDAALTAEAIPGERNDYGQRDVLDFEMEGASGKATVRSVWIVLRGEDVPRMITCFVL